MRGQAGIEGVLLFSILTIVIVFTIVTFVQRSGDIDRLKVQLEADRLCGSFKNSVNQAWVNGPGSRSYIDIPETLLGHFYNLTIYTQDQKAVISWIGGAASCTFITQNVTNSTYGSFQVPAGKRSVFNNGGMVIVS